MAKEVAGLIKLQIKGGAANPSPPVGPALGSKGINIMGFCKEFNARTQNKAGKVLPVVITYYTDKSFSFVIKTPPAAVQLLEAAKGKKGSGEPNRKKVYINNPDNALFWNMTCPMPRPKISNDLRVKASFMSCRMKMDYM